MGNRSHTRLWDLVRGELLPDVERVNSTVFVAVCSFSDDEDRDKAVDTWSDTGEGD